MSITKSPLLFFIILISLALTGVSHVSAQGTAGHAEGAADGSDAPGGGGGGGGGGGEGGEPSIGPGQDGVYGPGDIAAFGLSEDSANGLAGDLNNGGNLGPGVTAEVSADEFGGFSVGFSGPDTGEGGGGAPSNPQLAPVSGGAAQCLSSNQVRLSWNRVSGADEYPVRIRPVVASNGGERPRDDIFDPTTNVTYNSIVPGAEYSWWVHAKYSGTWDGNSVSYPPNFSCRFPAPSMSHTCNANGTVQLSWSSVSGADLYPVRISDANGANERTDDTVTGTSKTFSIELGKAYQWWVHAMRDGNWDGASLQNKTPFSCRMPAPTMSHTCNGDGTVTVSWGGVSGADSYPLRIQPVGGSETALTKSGSSRSHTFSIDYDRDYQWWVHAWRDSNWAGASIQNKRPINCPSPNPTASISGTGCTISAGNSSCSGSLTWSIDPDGDTRNPNVYNDTTDTQFSNNAARTNQSVTLPHGTTNFDARLGSETLESVNLTASCAGGSSWNGSACATPPPLPTITANGSGNNQSITEGETVLVAWDNNGHQGNCTLTPGVMGDGNSPDSSNQTPPVGTTEYRISCTDTNDVYTGANTVSDSVLVTASARPAPPTPTLSASPNPIDSGNSTTLDWDPRDAGSATNCQLRIHPTNQVVSVANVTADSSTSRTLTQTTSYKYRCQYDDAVYNTTAWRESSVVTVTVDRPGCTIPGQFNYDSNATRNDGSCVPVIFGCTDATANNHNSSANTDDGSCTYDPGDQSVTVTMQAARIGSAVWRTGNLNIAPGQGAQVRYLETNADSCVATDGVAAQYNAAQNPDTSIIEPTGGNSTRFAVECSNDTYSASDDVTITAQTPVCGDSNATNHDTNITSTEVRDDTVCTYPPAPSPTIEANGSGSNITVNSGAVVNIDWNPNGFVGSCVLSPNIGNGNVDDDENQTMTNTTTYTITCTDTQNRYSGANTRSDSVTVFVNATQPDPPTVSISANPAIVTRPNTNSTITWDYGGHTGTCGIYRNGSYYRNAKTGSPFTNSHSNTTNYEIRCTDTGNDYAGAYQVSDSATVLVRDPDPVGGCTDWWAKNYDASADVNDGSCQYYQCGDGVDNDGDGTFDDDAWYVGSSNPDTGCTYPTDDDERLPGCTDSSASNYDANAQVNDGSCIAVQSVSVTVDAAPPYSSIYRTGTLNLDWDSNVQPTVRWRSTGANVCTAIAGTGFSTSNRTNSDDRVTTPAQGSSDTFTVRCTNPTGGEDTDSVTITRASRPDTTRGDLVVTNTSPTNNSTVNSGVYTSFQASIQNVGSDWVRDNYWYELQIDQGRNGSIDITNDGRQFTDINAGGSLAVSRSVQLSSPGNYRYRFVVDTQNDVVEASETNNTSGWTNFTVQSTAGGYLNTSPRTCYIPEYGMRCSFNVNWLVNGSGNLMIRSNYRTGNFNNCTGSRCGSGFGFPGTPGVAGSRTDVLATYGRNNVRAFLDNTRIYHAYTDARCESGTAWNGIYCEDPADSGPPTATISADPNPCIITNEGASSCRTQFSQFVDINNDASLVTSQRLTQYEQRPDGTEYDRRFYNGLALNIQNENRNLSIGETTYQVRLDGVPIAEEIVRVECGPGLTEETRYSGGGNPYQVCVASSSGISGVDCTIPRDGSECDVELTWNIEGSGTPSVHNASDDVELDSGNATGVGQRFALRQNGYTIEARLDGTMVADTNVIVSCSPGQSWDNALGRCADTTGGPRVNANPETATLANPTVEIDVTNTGSCTTVNVFATPVGAARQLVAAGDYSDYGVDRNTYFELECDATVVSTDWAYFVPMSLNASSNFVRKETDFDLTWTIDSAINPTSCAITPGQNLDDDDTNDYTADGTDEAEQSFETVYTYSCDFPTAATSVAGVNNYYVSPASPSAPSATVTVEERVLNQPSFNET